MVVALSIALYAAIGFGLCLLPEVPKAYRSVKEWSAKPRKPKAAAPALDGLPASTNEPGASQAPKKKRWISLGTIDRDDFKQTGLQGGW